MNPAVRVINLKKTFFDKKSGEVKAVDGISFEANYGEIFALLGPNGAGKTTTLRMMATVLKPTSGYVEIDGFNVLDNPLEVRKRIGFLPGDSGLYHRLTPRELVIFFGRFSGLDKKESERRTIGIFESLGIIPFMDTKIEKLSTGMRQRVSLARTLISDPPVLILDEPASGLDVPTAHLVEEFIIRSKKEGKCVILSTHMMEEAEFLADRIAVIHEGKIKALGTMEELRKKTGKDRLREIFMELLK
jgi:sodium transport system ATP-binding protein